MEQSQKVVSELIITFILLVLLVALRGMFVGQIAGAGTPYQITYQNYSTATNTTVTQTETVTPTSAMSVAQADSLYSIIIYVVAIIAFAVIILTVAGKL